MGRESKEDLESLYNSTDTRHRGREFEKLLNSLLSRDGFEVHHNARSATPRQTDSLVRDGDKYFLIEAKWQSSKIDVSVVDGVRSRLDRTPAHVFGCVFSMSDYTKPAVLTVEGKRDREILLFSALEIQSLFNGRKDLRDLIERKRSSLTVDARMWFFDGKQTAPPAIQKVLPETEQAIRRDDHILSSVASSGDIDEVVFAMDMPDITWGPVPTEGVGLFLHLQVQFLWELREVIGLIHEQLRLSGSGSFTISQLDHSWFGIGLNEFLAEADRWQARYNEVSLQRVHHSEDLLYFDTVECGFLMISARQRVGDSVYLHQVELEIRLPGVPVDVAPFLKICRATQNRGASFSPLRDTRQDVVHLRKEKIRVQPVAWIHSHRFGPDSVSGLVARNPFCASRVTLPKGKLDNSPLMALRKPELIVCTLGDWHEPEDEMDYYYLTRLEGMWTASAPIVQVACTWGDPVRTGNNVSPFSTKIPRAAK